jgi:glycosyltransferase involved in cell wall biosynthesis
MSEGGEVREAGETVTERHGEGGCVPRVSVIVPFFNSAAFLERCIEALLASRNEAADLARVELLFVDNGSSDGSAALASRYGDVRVLREDRPGAYPARNTGLRAATGSIIAFTDADCAVAPDWIPVICRRMADPALGMLIGEVQFPEAAGVTLQLVAGWENAKADYVARKGAPANRIAYCNNMAVRADLFQRLGPFRDWQRAGDSEFAQRAARECPELAFDFESGMRVTHHEFLRARDRFRRMRLYSKTNARIEGFAELSLSQRLAILGEWLTGRRRR